MSLACSAALLRLELAEARRARWLVFTLSIYAAIFAMFVWLGMRESSVIGFTGVTRVVLNVTNVLVLFIPLVALVATSQSVVRARATGFLELFLAQPVGRADWFGALAVSRLVVVVGPLFVLMAGAALWSLGSRGDAHASSVVARCLATTTSLAWAFVGVGFYLSSLAKTAERATILSLGAWLAAALLHDFALVSALLKWKLPPTLVFAVAAANPVEAARVAMLSSVDPELSVLGPVGFWISHTLGPTLSLAVGTGWPAALGSAFFFAAFRRIRRADLVG